MKFSPNALKSCLLAGFAMLLFPAATSVAQQKAPDIRPLLAAYNVSWDVPGPTSAASMPLGNGDIGLNVWTEPSGDLVFYIGKTDAWSEDPKGSKGLIKLGAVRVSLKPSPLAAGSPFLQVLKLHEGEIEVREGTPEKGAMLRVWVDANHPVIHVEMTSAAPVSVRVALENWRKSAEGSLSADHILPKQQNRIAWYHRNGEQADPHVKNLTFGGVIKGQGLVSKDDITLESATPVKAQLISVHVLTATTSTPEQWLTQLEQQMGRTDGVKLEQAWQAHLQWWNAFWNRSWIYITGDEAATEVTRGYILQRFITACGGRGAYPIKFNGSIFNVDMPALPDGADKPPKSVNADYRDWGGQYWFQNTRAAYWPRLEAGDFDVMLPLFKMYAAMLPANTATVKEFYKHGGAYFAETAPFWGGMEYAGPDAKELWTRHYFVPILEISMMMLDYYEFTGDKTFAKQILLPVVSAGLQFYNEHFQRDAQGKILLDPVNSIEMFWKVHNPAPDIAAMRAILPRLLAFPPDLVTPAQRASWTKMLGEVPELPIGVRNQKKLLLPYTGEQTAKRRNSENPELYAIFPYRLYGIGKPDLALAQATFNGRSCRAKGCWVQDPIQAAMLGFTDVAKDYVTFALTNKDRALKFPAFWAKGNDYMPDQDNGGNGEHGLQQMLMQTDGRKILLLPAWPKEWNAEFKLNAPYRTTVQGRVENGKILDLVVTPPERKADVIDVSAQSSAEPAAKPVVSSGSVKSLVSRGDTFLPVKQTLAGQPNVAADADEVRGGPELAFDGSVESKSFNAGQDRDGFNPRGVNTGFAVTPHSGTGAVSAIQIATGNDVPERDPLSITIEGSNTSNADQTGGSGFVTLYEGPTGLAADPGRNKWGPVIKFPNMKIFKTYRVLVTETRGDGADAVQFSEIRLGPAQP